MEREEIIRILVYIKRAGISVKELKLMTGVKEYTGDVTSHDKLAAVLELYRILRFLESKVHKDPAYLLRVPFRMFDDLSPISLCRKNRERIFHIVALFDSIL